jgi:DNA helicase II / ATP-dependent DNA helicase PcrA
MLITPLVYSCKPSCQPLTLQVMGAYLDALNDQQKEAVITTDGPLMIVAGAGSGKTKVLTTRIAHLIANGVDAFRILALTFTNKAAAEMKERVEHILGNGEAKNLYIGTFHSVFARILRQEGTLLGYPQSFTIYDSDDSKSVVKTIINELQLDDKIYKPNTIFNRISAAKNALVGFDEYRADQFLLQEDIKAQRPRMADIYELYVKRCFKNGAMDFDDLLFQMYRLLKMFPDVLHKYQHRFRYVMIDEYQDTNPAQYEIIKLLAAVNENICVVGDDAQSIYSFRGATIENILQFRKDYDDVRIIKLEQNYRSTQSILNVANEVISNNKKQIQKNLWTENKEGEKLKLVRVMTDNDEGRFVADSIKEMQMRNHYDSKDFAILYRTNAQSRPFEEALRRFNIPYKIYGGLSFYQRKEVKDFIAYLRVIVNPHDEEALKRIINYPVRGIGKTTIEKAVTVANHNNVSLWTVVTQAANAGFKASTLENLNLFVQMVQYFQSLLGKENAYVIAEQVGKHTNIVKELFNDKSSEGVARYENIRALLSSIKEFTETPNEDGEVISSDLGVYLQNITLLTDTDRDQDPNADVVKLMTIHAAKGLEFPVVYVVGLEEGLFPSAMSVNTREELEEERRLFYVAVTRAKIQLYLSYAQTRYRFGNMQAFDPSRFLSEIPENYLDKSFSGGGMRNQSSVFGNQSNAFERMRGNNFNKANGDFNDFGNAPAKRTNGNILSAKPTPNLQVNNHVPSANFVASDVSELETGMKVEHQKFGFGTIAKLEGSQHNPIATISFEKNGDKKIMLNYAKLMIIK